MTAALRILACAALLLVGSADRAAAQPACGDTLTASTTLTADLACTGTGLKVGADKITIDLGGFTLSGDNTDVGIDNGLGFDGVTVKNGHIVSFGEGISIGGNAQKNVVTGVRIEFCQQDAIDLNDSDLTKITKSTILNNGNGVQIGADATGNVVEKSTIIGSIAGVEIQGTGNVVQKSRFVANGTGVRVLNGPNRVVGNTVDISDQDGIAVQAGSGSEVSKNTVVSSTASGIEVKDAASTLVTKNTVTGNFEIGINVVGASHDSTVSKNTVRGNRPYGIVVEDATNVLVQSNTVTGSRSTGIFPVSPTTVVRKNEAIGNLGFGIRVSTTAIDGGGNVARDNGDGECDGVVCKD